MQIYVYFKCDDIEHQEYKIQYDLTYPEDNKSIENRTIKRISFTMPNESFLSKLLKAGATVENSDSKIFTNRLEGMISQQNIPYDHICYLLTLTINTHITLLLNMLMFSIGMKSSKNEKKNHDKLTPQNEGQKKGMTQTKEEKIRVKKSKLEHPLEQKPKLKRKKSKLMDHHESGNNILLG